jgi:hypothetical protein
VIPGAYDLVLYRGDHRVLPLAFEDDQEPPQPHDLTGLTWHAQIRDTPNSADVRANFAVSVVDALNGEIEVILTAAEAENLTELAGVWDLQSTDPEGVVQTWVAGSVAVLFDVTRIEPSP